MRVLIADDNRMDSLLISTLFQQKGWEVRAAYDSMQALMYANREPRPNLVILDVQMPGGSGVKAMERLGVVAFLPKPPDPEALLAAAERATLGSGG